MIYKLFLITFLLFCNTYHFAISKEKDNAKQKIEEIENKKDDNKKNKQNIEQNKTEKNKENGFTKFIKNYILPDENQIFENKVHLISIFGGYDYGKFDNVKWLSTKVYGDVRIYDEYSYEGKRKNGEIAISYSLPTKFWWFNGRFSIGLFTWIMNQNIENEYRGIITNGSFLNHTLGFEMVEELIFGHPNLYFTFGFGVSYQIVLGTSNLKTNNKYYNENFYYRKPKILWNNSNFNFVIKASLGHKFKNGLILELTWKHYSNGNLGTANWGLNFLGATIGYIF